MAVPSSDFLTPRAAGLTLRGATDPDRQRPTERGEPLLVTDRLPDGFVEVDIDGELWLALDSALEPWRGAGQLPAAQASAAAPVDPKRAAAITPPPKIAAGAKPAAAKGGLPWWSFVIGGLLSLSLLCAVLAATGWWQTPAGWTLCESGARIDRWEMDGARLRVGCAGGHRPRRWFRDSGGIVPAVAPLRAAPAGGEGRGI